MNHLRTLLHAPEILVVPGVFDAFGALFAQQAGFSALYLSGASLSITRYGHPDIGLVSMNEVIPIISAIKERIELPLIVDADTGYGNALNVIRTVRLFEQNGASGIQLEDQIMPKRCGHLDGKQLVPVSEMVGKIKAATDARQDAETLIIARTDALAVEGFVAALDRGEQYYEAGADMLFIEAPRSQTQMQKINQRFYQKVPLMANMVEGGKTPLLSSQELEKLGYSCVIFPGGFTRAIAFLAQQYFAVLKRDGSTKNFRERMLDFQELNDLIGTAQILEKGKFYNA